MTIRKGNTKLTVDQIIDGAADVLEKYGWITGRCEDEAGGHCAIGAVAKAVYPKVNQDEIEDLSYVDRDVDGERGVSRCECPACSATAPTNVYVGTTGRHAGSRHVEALSFLAKRFGYKAGYDGPLGPSFVDHVINVNDDYPDDGDAQTRFVSSKRIVKRFRNAAEAYRRQANR